MYFLYIAQDENTLSPADTNSWLNVDPAQLETYLNQHWGNVKDKKLEKQESLSLREKVQSFLNQTSDIDGVHFLGYDFYLSEKSTILKTIIIIYSQNMKR